MAIESSGPGDVKNPASTADQTEGFAHLQALKATRGHPNLLDSPLSLDGLEMLEAELQNQGILPKTSVRVSQLAQQEVAFLRWRLRGHRLDASRVRFLIDIPRFVLRQATKAQDESRHTTQTQTSLIPSSRDAYDLAYLERFASYLTGTLENPSHRYKHGLCLLLRLVGSQAEDLCPNEVLDVTVPISVSELVALVRGHQGQER